MSWKNHVGIEQWHPMYQEPMKDEHETDECDTCHDDGLHKDPLAWFDVCQGCADDLAETVAHASYEFAFTVEDVAKAREWARVNGLIGHENVQHLLLEAMNAGIIHARTWRAA